MDTTKGIALASSCFAPVWDYTLGRAEIEGPIKPIIQVPTMAGTGSEMNGSAVLIYLELHIKQPLGGIEPQSLALAIESSILICSTWFSATVPNNGLNLLSAIIGLRSGSPNEEINTMASGDSSKRLII
jgi:Iron-containing alcohol dehydrogenase